MAGQGSCCQQVAGPSSDSWFGDSKSSGLSPVPSCLQPRGGHGRVNSQEGLQGEEAMKSLKVQEGLRKQRRGRVQSVFVCVCVMCEYVGVEECV